jgi:hypothetical protein
MKRFIGYHFFHSVRKIAPVEAYSRTQHAMSVFTNQKVLSIRAFMLDMRDDHGGPLESLFQNLCVQFGPVSGTMKGISVRGGPNYRAHQWILSAKQFQESFSLLTAVHRDIPLSRERAHLQASWSFKFVEPVSGALLPDQEAMPVIDVRLGSGSSLNLTTGKKTSVNAWFLFPFESPSRDFEDYVARFQKELIFTFSPKHWRLWKSYPVKGLCPRRFVPGWYISSGAFVVGDKSRSH